MISVAFINNTNETLLASDPFLSLERAMMQMSEEVDSAISDYNQTYNQYMIESEIMGEIAEEKTLFLEAEGKNIFDKIGEAVLSIFKKFQDIITKIIGKLKGVTSKQKNQEEKMNEAINYFKKNEPDKWNTIKDDVIVAFKNGELESVNLKTLNEMNDYYDALLKLAKQKDVKPDTLRGKFEEMKKKFANIDKPVKTVTNIIVLATAIITFKSKVLDSKKTISISQKQIAEDKEATIKAINELKNYKDGEYASEALTKAQILQNVLYWKTGQYGKLISKEQGKIDKLDKGITSWLSKYEKAKRDKFMNDIAKGNDVIKYKEQKARDNERAKNREDAYDKARAQKDAQSDAILDKNSNKHRKAIKQEARLKAQASAKAQRHEADKAIYNRDHQYTIQRTAELQAQGRDAGTPQKTPPKTHKIELVDSKGRNINDKTKTHKNNP